MKKIFNYYIVYSIFLITIFNITAFVIPSASGAFNKYGAEFATELAIYNIAMIANIIIASLIANLIEADKKFTKKPEEYKPLIILAVSLLGIFFTGIVFMLFPAIPQFIGFILAFLVVCCNVVVLLIENGNTAKLIAFLSGKVFKFVVIPAVAVIIAAVVLSITVFIPSAKYNKANSFVKSGDIKNAILTFKELNGYKDSAAKITELSKDNNLYKLYAAKVGDSVIFGKYEQDNAGGKNSEIKEDNGPEDIEWLVIGSYKNQLLLMSKYCLDAKAFNDEYVAITWENSTLRKWLNSEFLKAAFSAEEQKMIMLKNLENPNTTFANVSIPGGHNTKDKVFLLSYAEANVYANTKALSIAQPTAYAIANGAYINSATNNCWWWLRSPGPKNLNAAHANITEEMDDLYSVLGVQVDKANHAVRPCIWVDLTK